MERNLVMHATAQSQLAAYLTRRRHRPISSTPPPSDRGVLGAPTMFVGEQMFFGNDRIMFVNQALEAA